MEPPVGVIFSYSVCPTRTGTYNSYNEKREVRCGMTICDPRVKSPTTLPMTWRKPSELHTHPFSVGTLEGGEMCVCNVSAARNKSFKSNKSIKSMSLSL